MSTLLNVGIVLVLILIEGLFVGAEIALVSLRESQVRGMEERSRRGARVARLVHDPNRFLAAVQIGVTTTALLSSAFGAATLSDQAKNALQHHGVGSGLAGVIAFLGVFLAISYVTLVLGELVPKRLALQRAEGAAELFAPALDRIAFLVRPVIWLLSKSTDGVVRLFGGDPSARQEAISEEELRGLVAAHEALNADERQLIDEVFAAKERQVREVMIPRTEVTFLDTSEAVATAAEQSAALPHSRYPVVRGSQDDVVGFVHVRDLVAALQDGRRDARVSDVTREVKRLPSTKTVLGALSEMRREGHHLAVVVDEYGGTAGIVTLEDLIEEVIGDIRDEYDPEEAASRPLQDGATEVDGLLNLDEFEEATGVALPEGPYETAAGFVVNRLGHLPQVGEAVEAAGVRLEVTDLDGRRISRVCVSRVAPAGDAADGAAPAEEGSAATGLTLDGSTTS